MFLNPEYTLSNITERHLLAALLSQFGPDSVRQILRLNIAWWAEKYRKTGADFCFWATEKEMRVFCIKQGNLDYGDLDRLKSLEFVYNTIDKWGMEYESKSDL